MPKDPYYSTPVRETKHGIFIRKPPKGGSPISIIINEGDISSIERHHMIKIKQKENMKQKSNVASDFTISTDEETQPSSSPDEGRITRKEIQNEVERIRGIKTTSKLKDGSNTNAIPSVYKGVTLQSLGRVSSNISTSMRRRSRSRSRGDHHESKRNTEMHNYENREAKRVGDAVIRRVRSFSVSAKDKIRSRSRSIVRSFRKDKKDAKEKMVFVQQSYEEDKQPIEMEDVTNEGSGFLGLGFLCGGFDAMCGSEDTEQNGEDSMKM